MFKKICLIVPLIISPAVFAAESNAGKDYCAIKEEKINQQIEYAKKYNNPHRLAGLERALSNVKAHCSNNGYIADAESKIADKERKVEKRRQELAEAKATGKSDKISKKQKKLQKAEAELDEALNAL
ncbi:DUF1090 domain-containing protein [Limnobaculum zhutongyuii]|uniref:DUF1090 domain-containing protein n=1 Tax=Limnobaculum zhutongyuii TaxID=2498113 RepID=A0A411WK77_9GAMM|nr:DUF1090 domain-containing protein [Limnobaculum zhutongyuii]QBH96568.1 DUF1090 domain-containing protein [Limnobaculum zhutongyuii]TQS90401.1 DUF1090 domain-containing protein [Limnobaculum zhutongyuii]